MPKAARDSRVHGLRALAPHFRAQRGERESESERASVRASAGGPESGWGGTERQGPRDGFKE